MIDFVRVGQQITLHRRKNNLTQDMLADKLFVTRQALSKWENGTGVPSTDTILELCKIFSIGIEELLCLNDDKPIDIDPENIFSGHERTYIVDKLINHEIDVNLADVFYQLSPTERMRVLKSIKEKDELVLDDLYVKLTISEQKFIGGSKWKSI